MGIGHQKKLADLPRHSRKLQLRKGTKKVSITSPGRFRRRYQGGNTSNTHFVGHCRRHRRAVPSLSPARLAGMTPVPRDQQSPSPYCLTPKELTQRAARSTGRGSHMRYNHDVSLLLPCCRVSRGRRRHPLRHLSRCGRMRLFLPYPLRPPMIAPLGIWIGSGHPCGGGRGS